MGLWKASSVKDCPRIQLTEWKIYEASSPLWEGRTRHFSGYNLTEYEGRASSAIKDIDKDALIGITESGRIYELVSDRITMNQIADADYVWGWYSTRNQLFNIVDVSEEYIKEVNDGRGSKSLDS